MAIMMNAGRYRMFKFEPMGEQNVGTLVMVDATGL